MTPVLLHDGKRYGYEHYFTSIDGKIIVAQDSLDADFDAREGSDSAKFFNRDFMSKIIRLQETEFGREPNWCRGIEKSGDSIFVTVDGRYGSDLSFGVVEIVNEKKLGLYNKLKWADIGDEKELRFVTGFDVCLI